MAVILSVVLKLSIVLVFKIISVNSSVSSGLGDSIFPNSEAVIWLKPNEHYLKEDDSELQIFCFKSSSKSLLEIWRSVDLILESVPISYSIFSGTNEFDVREKYKSHSIFHPSSWFPGQKTSVDFPAFSQACVGIATTEKYTIFLHVRTANYWKFLMTLIGLLLFMSAPSLSRNSFFHYTSAVTLGVVGSLLVLLFIISKFIPKKSTSLAVFIFGTSFILYILRTLWKDINNIIYSHMDLLLGYCLIAAFISFIVCYRLGPVQNVRTFKIIQWSMQVIASLLIFCSSEYREVPTAIILIMITLHVIPSRWITKCRQVWFRFFPPKVRLLSELEFIEQGHIETKKGLEDLRKYCSSPDCNVWKTVTRLKDPLRFAEFIDTGNHCTDQELLRYNSEDFDGYNESDSDVETFESSYMDNRRNGYRNK